MKKLSILSIVIIFVLAGVSITNAQNQNYSWEGEWSTVWDTGSALLTLVDLDTVVIGTYMHKDGKIKAYADNNQNGLTLNGTWDQTNSKGWFRFTMNNDFKSFTGEWGNNDDETIQGKWNGINRDVFDIPKIRREQIIDIYYSADQSDSAYAKSLADWENLKNENGNSYIYEIRFGSWTGFGHTTQIKVENGIVTERIYKEFKYIDGEEKILSSYTENNNQIGMHTKGDPAITIDELYKKGKIYLDADKTLNDIIFTTFNNGLLKSCGYWPKNCSDDCFVGVNIFTFEWINN